MNWKRTVEVEGIPFDQFAKNSNIGLVLTAIFHKTFNVSLLPDQSHVCIIKGRCWIGMRCAEDADKVIRKFQAGTTPVLDNSRKVLRGRVYPLSVKRCSPPSTVAASKTSIRQRANNPPPSSPPKLKVDVGVRKTEACSLSEDDIAAWETAESALSFPIQGLLHQVSVDSLAYLKG
jgi:hypothetical protein